MGERTTTQYKYKFKKKWMKYCGTFILTSNINEFKAFARLYNEHSSIQEKGKKTSKVNLIHKLQHKVIQSLKELSNKHKSMEKDPSIYIYLHFFQVQISKWSVVTRRHEIILLDGPTSCEAAVTSWKLYLVTHALSLEQSHCSVQCFSFKIILKQVQTVKASITSLWKIEYNQMETI